MLRQNEITVRDALLTILESKIGYKDLNSYKYQLVENLFGIAVESHKEAEQLVEAASGFYQL